MTEGSSKATGGTAFTSLNAGGMQTALFYNLDVKRDATASVTLGALQDNGIVTNAPPAAFPRWTVGVGGDGFARRARRAEPDRSLWQEQRHDRRLGDRRQLLFGHHASMVGRGIDSYLAAVATDPNTAGGVYASSNQNLWQSTTSGRDVAEEGCRFAVPPMT